MSSIVEYIEGRLDVHQRTFDVLSISEREEFLKYQVPVIDLDLRDDDPDLIEIFKRLNRTFYSLSTIERFSTEYASSEFMLVAKVLCDELLPPETNDLDEYLKPLPQEYDPNISRDLLDWARDQNVSEYQNFVLSGKIFSPHETSRMVHLMYTLNLMATHMTGFYNRNDKARDYLEEYSETLPFKDRLVDEFERTAHLINQMKLPKGSIWTNKANAFTLFVMISQERPDFQRAGAKAIRTSLDEFESNLPVDYTLAAREAVNNRPQRMLRHDLLRTFIRSHLGF